MGSSSAVTLIADVGVGAVWSEEGGGARVGAAAIAPRLQPQLRGNVHQLHHMYGCC